MMFPAEKNRIGLVTECAVICRIAAAMATGVPMPKPIAISPMFSMLEYASILFRSLEDTMNIAAAASDRNPKISITVDANPGSRISDTP